jgi:predicted short-subunit dehydrogenase-like oxidoreductase (DUF2520 family)
MKVVIVGAGNVATHIALAFRAAKIEPLQIWSKQYQNAVILAKQVDANAIENLSEVDQNADFCIIAVKDDAIASIVGELACFKGIIVHTSGAVKLDVFRGASENYGVLYPLQTFSKNKTVDFNAIPICIEANNLQTLKRIAELAKKLSSHLIEVNSEKRKILHLAAIFACNFTNHLYALSAELLHTNDLSFDFLRPLILETASKVQQALPLEVQTGPAIRNDEQTLKKHRELLANNPQLLNIYKTLSDSIKKTQK